MPEAVDLILFEQGIPAAKGTYTFHRDDPSATVAEILRGNEDIALALARQFPAFRARGGGADHPCRGPRERALRRRHGASRYRAQPGGAALGLRRICLRHGVPHRQSDSHGFLIAAAYGKEVGFAGQKGAILSIAAGAFGWRALARELVGKIPLGGGLIPKGAIAYAGTYAVGKGLEFYYGGNGSLSRGQRRTVFREALDRGREVAAGVAKEWVG